MYRYEEHDRRLVAERVEQFRGQTRRYLAGEIEEAQFLPLRLQNGLYIQRLAPMLRVSVPYGMLSSTQLRRLASISRDYDKGYAHISTRQNIQFNWPRLEAVPDLLAELAEVEMHAIQTSGNCIRNVTTDQFAGVAKGEVADPRPWCEIIRQWATFHPEFAFLPRKFKIAVNANAAADRAAVRVHDIGLEIERGAAGETSFRVFVGGGLGRTPMIGPEIRAQLPAVHLLSYLEAILRVYNQLGRRDNKYKARIKILVAALGAEEFARRVDAEWRAIASEQGDQLAVGDDLIAHFQSFFTPPQYRDVDLERARADLDQAGLRQSAFQRWLRHNVSEHRIPGYAIATVSLKTPGIPPGDLDDRQMEVLADLAERHSHGEARTTHEQNVALGDVPMDQLPALWEELVAHRMGEPLAGTLNDIICCPGGDFCSLANAKSIPLAETLQREFSDYEGLREIGGLDLNISGCMNACGHHHVGHIGVLGVDKKGQEFYQVSIGGNAAKDASLGKILGPSFSREELPGAVRRLVEVYLERRTEGERFLDTCRRIGVEPFKQRAYEDAG